MIDIIPSFAVGFACGIGATFLWAFLLPDKKRCPGAMCKNVLPQRGTWDPKRSEWAIEECPICLTSVQFVSRYHNPSLTDSSDHYVRVLPKEAK